VKEIKDVSDMILADNLLSTAMAASWVSMAKYFIKSCTKQPGAETEKKTAPLSTGHW